MSIRIIYTNSIEKIKYQVKLLKNLNIFKNNNKILYYEFGKINEYDVDFFEFNKIKYCNNILQKVKYNIFIDFISEKHYDYIPSEYTILFINDKYLLNNNYIRREYFIDSPLKLLDDSVDYYFCLTKYSYKILSKNINKKKLYLLDGVLSIPVEIPIKNNNIKYIYYKIDPHSKQYNINLLKVWIENYINSPYKLIINLYYLIEDIVDYIKTLLFIDIFIHNNSLIFYNNIIIMFRDGYLELFKKNIYISIINISNYSLVIELYKNIIDNNFIVTNKNKISSELLGKNALYLSDFSEDSIKIMFESLFKLEDSYIKNCILNNYKSLTKKENKTSKILDKFFS